MFSKTLARPLRIGLRVFLALAALSVVGILVWQGITASGNPDPTVSHLNQNAAILDTGILVFREGLECILVLAAVTASMIGSNQSYRRPIAAGAGLGFLATVATWFVAIAVLQQYQRARPGHSGRDWFAGDCRVTGDYELVFP